MKKIKIKALLLIVLLALPILVFSQKQVNKTNEQTFIKELVSVINTENNQDLLDFINVNFKNEEGKFITKQRLERFRLNTGGIIFQKVHISENPIENETIVVVKDKNYELPRTIFIVYELSLKQSLKELDFGLYRKVEEKISEEDMIKAAARIVDGISEKDIFSGAVLIAKKDKVLFKVAKGEASKRFHVKNKVDTKFNLGSMNKMFTSLSIMKLVEEGKLNLNDNISLYLDESWLPKNITDQITIRHLLGHSSGLGSFFNSGFFNSSRESLQNLEDYKRLIKNETLAFKPGERFSYSNTGMFLLGIIIQEVSGQDYYQFIRNNIYKPANMKNSDSYSMNQPVENLAIGYTKANNKYGYENNILKHVVKGGPAGGGFSTVDDLHNYALSLMNETLISKASKEIMWKDYYNTNNYGYGFKVEDYKNEKIVGHSGGFYGISSDLSIFTKSGYIVIVLSNYEGSESLTHKITSLILSVISK